VCSSGSCATLEASCAAILSANAQAPSGAYRIDLDGAGSSDSIDVYCDMTTNGGGWQLISVVRRSPSALIVGAGYCTDPHPITACKGQLHPAQVSDAAEIMIRDFGSGDFLTYAGFSASASSGLRYLSRELTLDGSSDCGTFGENTCADTSADPALRVQVTSGYTLNYNEPLTQWWRYGGWWVGAPPNEADTLGVIHATGYTGLQSLNSRTTADGPSAVQSSGHQQLFFR
jgi:hypothetical protein